MLRVRDAVAADAAAVDALLAPEILAGHILPQHSPPFRRLVAVDEHDQVVGAVALTPWTEDVIELGALVSGPRSQGIGRLLVQAALQAASRSGYDLMVALTGVPRFFARVGFAPHDDSPWRWARRAPLRIPEGHLGKGLLNKSFTCAGCPRLGTCSQTLMTHPLVPALAPALSLAPALPLPLLLPAPVLLESVVP